MPDELFTVSRNILNHGNYEEAEELSQDDLAVMA
jgi:hypothetical protein